MKSLHKNVVQSRITIIFTNSRCTFLHRDDQWQNDKYKLLSIPDEGDIGIVYLAQQEEPVRYQTSVKIIYLGIDSPSFDRGLNLFDFTPEIFLKLIDKKQ
jgi:hypothetical protein